MEREDEGWQATNRAFLVCVGWGGRRRRARRRVLNPGRGIRCRRGQWWRRLAWPVCAVGGKPSVGSEANTADRGGCRGERRRRGRWERRENWKVGQNHDLAHLSPSLSSFFFFCPPFLISPLSVPTFIILLSRLRIFSFFKKKISLRLMVRWFLYVGGDFSKKVFHRRGVGTEH
jgi:hypothetical protein